MTARRRSALPVVVATMAGAFLLLLAVPNIAPVVRAARGAGTPGIFTADRTACTRHMGHRACTWYGTFTPAAGGGRGRRDVGLYGSGGGLRPGLRVAAIDVGRESRVYPPGGSREWMLTTALGLCGIVLLIPLARTALAPVRGGRWCGRRGSERDYERQEDH